MAAIRNGVIAASHAEICLATLTLLLSHTQSDKRWRPFERCEWRPVYRFQMRCVIDALLLLCPPHLKHTLLDHQCHFCFCHQERVPFSSLPKWMRDGRPVCLTCNHTARNWNAAFASQLIVLLHSCVLLTFDVLPCHKHIERWQSINGHSFY